MKLLALTLMFSFVIGISLSSSTKAKNVEVYNLESGWILNQELILKHFNSISTEQADFVSISKSTEAYFLCFWLDDFGVISYALEMQGQNLALSREGGVYLHEIITDNCSSCGLDGKNQLDQISAQCKDETCEDCRCNHKLTYTHEYSAKKSKLFKLLRK